LGFATLRRVYLPNEVENMTGEALENWRDMRRVAARRGVEVVLEKSPWHRAEERFWELWDEMEAREGRLLE
jgi:sugar phosphate isomerase/epimerase